MGCSLDPEVVGRQFGVVNLQHDPGVLQALLSHLQSQQGRHCVKFWLIDGDVMQRVCTRENTPFYFQKRNDFIFSNI